MQTDSRHDRGSLERGVVILSIDTEQRWGYLDLLDGPRFDSRYPDALGAHDRLLAALCAAGVSATWFVVGGMSLRGSRGARDRRMAGLPAAWVAHIPVGNETTMPLWYRQSFVERLRAASPHQEIGLHGGLTHFIWTDERATQDVVEWELVEGLKALRQVRVQPLSFSFGREREAHHELLLRHGIRSYRGRTTSLAHRLGSTIPGAMLRAINELTLGDTVAGVAARDAAGACGTFRRRSFFIRSGRPGAAPSTRARASSGSAAAWTRRPAIAAYSTSACTPKISPSPLRAFPCSTTCWSACSVPAARAT